MSGKSTESTPNGFSAHLEGLAQREIRFPLCVDCGRFHWYPMPRCPHCQSPRLHSRPASGKATLFTWTVVRHAFHPSLRDAVPYVVAAVTFADVPGVRLITNLVGVEFDDIRVGMELRPVFDVKDGDGGPATVRFHPA